jgi:hypothetical protein
MSSYTHDDHSHDDEPVDTGPIIPFDDLIFACTNLCELLEIENDAVSAHDPETVKVLLQNKMTLARLYEQAMQPMITSPELAETLEPEQCEELVAVGLRLKDLLDANAMRLHAEIESYQTVMDIVARHAKREAVSVSIYGRDGVVDRQAEASNPIAYNKSL